MFNYPDAPTVGQQVTGPNSAVYKWDGVKWTSAASGGGGGSQTPWTQNVDAAGYLLSNVPTVSASAILNLAAGGAGSLNLRTNAKTRLSIDATGNVFTGIRDDGFRVLFFGDSTSDPVISAVTAGDLAINAKSLGGVALGTSTKARLSIDSAGHVAIASADDVNASLNVAGITRLQNHVELGTIVALNAYYNGSNWFYRANGATLFINTAGIYGSPSGTAGTVASFPQYLGFNAGLLTTVVTPLAMYPPPPNTAAYESLMTNSSILICASSNTQLVFRYKGTDGVFRQGTLNLA